MITHTYCNTFRSPGRRDIRLNEGYSVTKVFTTSLNFLSRRTILGKGELRNHK